MQDLNTHIKPSHLRALEKFKAELEKYKETCDPDGTLYEDPFTSFTLSDIKVENGYLTFFYDGAPDKERVVFYDKESKEYYEAEYDGIMSYIHFWRKCLRRAQKYWTMNVDELDALQNGEAEDNDDDED